MTDMDVVPNRSARANLDVRFNDGRRVDVRSHEKGALALVLNPERGGTELGLRNKDDTQNDKKDSQPLLAKHALPQEQDRPDGNEDEVETHKRIGKA